MDATALNLQLLCLELARIDILIHRRILYIQHLHAADAVDKQDAGRALASAPL